MAITNQLDRKRKVILCQRCGGRMAFEKYYGVNESYFGWRCVICGDILDPVILLHRVSQEADLAIPEREEEMIALIKKHLRVKVRKIRPQASRSKTEQRA